MGNFTIYTFGNLDAIYNILMSIATFFGGGTFLSMVKLAGITTILLFLFNAVGITAKGNISQPLDLTFFIKFYLAYWILAVAPANKVTIIDRMTNENKVISISGGTGNAHLPLGVVLVNSYMSQFFNALVDAYETYFETGSSGQPGLGYTKSGMAFGSNFVSSAKTFTSGDMQFDTNLQNYFANCALPIANNSGAINAMAQSSDILQFFKDNFATQQKARYVLQLKGSNNEQVISTCYDSILNLSSTWTAMNDSVLNHIAKQMGFGGSPVLTNNFIAAGGVTANQLLGISGNATSAIKQAISMNIAYKAMQVNATQVNAISLANSAYDAQQFQQYKAGGELSGEMAARVTPALKIFAEALLFMFYPFMVFYCLVTSSFLPFLKYIKYVATVNAIPFVYEVLNSTINWYAQVQSAHVASDGGFTLMNASNLYALNSNIVATANYLAMSVPLLAYALISGSDMAITGLFGHSTDPAKSASSTSGAELAKGNMNIGNSQLDNATYGNIQANNLSEMNRTFDNLTNNNATSFNRNIKNDTMDNQTLRNSTTDNLTNSNSTSFNKTMNNNTIDNQTLRNSTTDNLTNSNNTSFNRNMNNDTMNNQTLRNSTTGNLTSGNETINNKTSDNITMHQHNTAPTNKHGAPLDYEVLDSGSAVQTSADGVKTLTQANSTLAISPQIQNAVGKTVNDAYTKSVAKTAEASKSLQNAVSNGISLVNKYGTAEQKQQAAQIQSEINASASVGAQINTAGSLGILMGGLSANIGAGVSGKSTSTTTATSSVNNSKEIANSLNSLNSTTKAYKEASTHSEQLSHMVSNSNGTTLTISPNLSNVLVKTAFSETNNNAEHAEKLLNNSDYVTKKAMQILEGGENSYNFKPLVSEQASSNSKELNAALNAKNHNTYNVEGSSTSQEKIQEYNKQMEELVKYRSNKISIKPDGSATGNAVRNLVD